MSAHQMLMLREQYGYTDYTIVATASASNLNYPICQGATRGYGPGQTGDSITPTTFRGVTISAFLTEDIYFADDLLLSCTFVQSSTALTLASSPTQGANFFKRIEFWNSTFQTKAGVLNAADAIYSAGSWTWDPASSFATTGTFYFRIVYNPS